MGIIDDMPRLIIGLVVAAILLGTVFIVGVGLLANGTKGTACVNCQAITKTLFNNTEMILVLAVFIAIIGGAVAYAKFGKK